MFTICLFRQILFDLRCFLKLPASVEHSSSSLFSFDIFHVYHFFGSKYLLLAGWFLAEVPNQSVSEGMAVSQPPTPKKQVARVDLSSAMVNRLRNAAQGSEVLGGKIGAVSF